MAEEERCSCAEEHQDQKGMENCRGTHPVEDRQKRQKVTGERQIPLQQQAKHDQLRHQHEIRRQIGFVNAKRSGPPPNGGRCALQRRHRGHCHVLSSGCPLYFHVTSTSAPSFRPYVFSYCSKLSIRCSAGYSTSHQE